jgi:hypothetical protein
MSLWKFLNIDMVDILKLASLGRMHIIFSCRYKRSRIANDDAITVLGLIESRQKADPEFYYDYQLDGEGHLKTMFWCDSQSCMDYQSFGNVVFFDSNYRPPPALAAAARLLHSPLPVST